MTDSKIESAKKLLASGVPPKDVAKNLGVSIPTPKRWVPASTHAFSVLYFPFSETTLQRRFHGTGQRRHRTVQRAARMQFNWPRAAPTSRRQPRTTSGLIISMNGLRSAGG